MSTKSDDLAALQQAVEDMDGLAQWLLDDVYCLAGLALAALETPRGHSTEMMAEAFNSIRRRIETDGAAIRCHAAKVGCEYDNPQETERAIRRGDARRAALSIRQKIEAPATSFAVGGADRQ